MFRGFISPSSIVPFNADTWNDYFSARKFQDKDYRAAVVEGVRVAIFIGIAFPEKVVTMVSTAKVNVQYHHSIRMQQNEMEHIL